MANDALFSVTIFGASKEIRQEFCCGKTSVCGNEFELMYFPGLGGCQCGDVKFERGRLDFETECRGVSEKEMLEAVFAFAYRHHICLCVSWRDDFRRIRAVWEFGMMKSFEVYPDHDDRVD